MGVLFAFLLLFGVWMVGSYYYDKGKQVEYRKADRENAAFEEAVKAFEEVMYVSFPAIDLKMADWVQGKPDLGTEYYRSVVRKKYTELGVNVGLGYSLN
ncbi:MAG: hypothetical protein Q7R99_01480 [bacterium]|nr:hypothetical protein [bacterium]